MTKTLSAVCGLFCKGCSAYIATQEDPGRLELLAQRMNVSLEEMKCDGCRSGRRGPFCKTCEFIPCAQKRGHEFCANCDDFPCASLIAFAEQKPHRAEMIQDSARIRDVGYEKWFEEKMSHYSCHECGVVNSGYDLSCRHCGKRPPNDFVKAHLESIQRHFENIRKTAE